MDQQGDKFYQFMVKTLQFLVLVSLFSYFYSYLSGFPLFFSYNLQLSTLMFPLVARALDRKYMFLICNGILAFLAKNLRLSLSSLNDYNGLMKTAEDGVKHITDLPPILAEATVQENAASMDYMDNTPPIVTGEDEEEARQQPEQEDTQTGEILREEDEDEDEEEAEEEDDDGEVTESIGVEGDSPMEEINDARVSTEELNKKFEEFIRKMKEEMRIEAQQPLITV